MKYKKEIAEYVKKIDKLLDKGHLDPEKTRKRVDGAYNLEKVDHVPIIVKTAEEIFSRYDCMVDVEKNLMQELHNNYLSLQHKTDWLPAISPFIGVQVYASFFGGEVLHNKESDPWIKPILKSTDDIMAVKKPDIRGSKYYNMVINYIDIVKESTGNAIPLMMTDPQGPLDSVSELFKMDDFIMACITNKKEIHHLMEIATDIFIEFNRIQIERIGEDNIAMPGQGAWPTASKNNAGIGVSDDMAAVLSPDLYREFGVPYLSKVSEAFNGICVHSCGNYLHNLKNILSISRIRGINGASSPNDMDPAKTQKIIDNKCFYFTGMSHPPIGWGRSFTGEEGVDIYFNYFLKNVLGNGRGIALGGISGPMPLKGNKRQYNDDSTDVKFSWKDFNPSIEDKNYYYDKVVEESNKIIEKKRTGKG